MNLMSPSPIFNNYQLMAHLVSSIPPPIPPLTTYHFLLGPFECSGGGQLSRSPTPLWKGPLNPCAPLHWQRCELCPHKDGALKRTDNGGEGSLSSRAHLLRSARPLSRVWEVQEWGGGLFPFPSWHWN